jgi:hypothetical protein
MIKVSKSQKRALDIVVDMINNSYNSDKGEQALTLICGILNVDMDVEEPSAEIVPVDKTEPVDAEPINVKPATIGEPDGAVKAITSQLVDGKSNMNCADSYMEGELCALRK